MKIIHIIFIILLAFVTWNDIKNMQIPNRYHLYIFVLAIVAVLIEGTMHMGMEQAGAGQELVDQAMLWQTLIGHAVGFFVVSLPMFLLCLICPGGFGAGDIKLMAVCGLLLGWQMILASAMYGVFVGAIVSIILLLTKRATMKSQFAFGPCLCAGMVWVLLQMYMAK